MINNKKRHVAVVVVTYNRINNLKVCIAAIRKQTYYDYDIIIVNNGSTDGTKEYLDSQKGIRVIHQENLGGAGGFYTGMKYMFDHGYEWLLLMDDDGIPAENELEQLLLNYEEAKRMNQGKECIINALVIDKDDHEKLAFGWGIRSERSLSVKDYSRIKIFDGIHPFNGTLIKRSIIENIGFVKKEMFIWGDEEEYVCRAKKNGYAVKTISSAIHYHPKEKGTKGFLFPFSRKYYVLVKPTKMSHYFYRNKGYIYSHYNEKKSLYWKFIICHLFYNLTRIRIKEMVKVCRYYRRGSKGLFYD